jgi:hypothetical protein
MKEQASPNDKKIHSHLRISLADNNILRKGSENSTFNMNKINNYITSQSNSSSKSFNKNRSKPQITAINHKNKTLANDAKDIFIKTEKDSNKQSIVDKVEVVKCDIYDESKETQSNKNNQKLENILNNIKQHDYAVLNNNNVNRGKSLDISKGHTGLTNSKSKIKKINPIGITAQTSMSQLKKKDLKVSTTSQYTTNPGIAHKMNKSLNLNNIVNEPIENKNKNSTEINTSTNFQKFKVNKIKKQSANNTNNTNNNECSMKNSINNTNTTHAFSTTTSNILEKMMKFNLNYKNQLKLNKNLK